MLGIFVISGCVLMTCAGPPISGYTLGTLSGGRGQEYGSGYRAGGFVGMKDSQGDSTEHLVVGGLGSGTDNYASTGSNRYSIVSAGTSGHQQSPSVYSSDPTYSEASSGLPSGYGGQSTGGNPESMSLSGSSYSSDSAGTRGSSSDVGTVGGYASGSSPTGLSSYSSIGSNTGSHGGTGFVGYSESSGGHGISSVAERIPGEYSSSSNPSGSYVSYTVGGGPKTSAYASPSGTRGHGIGYSSSPSVSYMPVGHRGGSSQHPSSSYSSESVRPGSYSSSSLSSFLAGMQNAGSGNYNAGSTGGSHRGSHPFAMASHPNAIYSSRGPSSGYFSGGPYTRGGGGGGGKIILVKEGTGGGHPGHGYSGEHHSYAGGMFGGAAGGGYKIRSVGSGPSYGPSHLGGGYSSSGGYTAGGGHHGPGSGGSSSHGGSFFGLL